MLSIYFSESRLEYFYTIQISQKQQKNITLKFILTNNHFQRPKSQPFYKGVVKMKIERCF